MLKLSDRINNIIAKAFKKEYTNIISVDYDTGIVYTGAKDCFSHVAKIYVIPDGTDNILPLKDAHLYDNYTLKASFIDFYYCHELLDNENNESLNYLKYSEVKIFFENLFSSEKINYWCDQVIEENNNSFNCYYRVSSSYNNYSLDAIIKNVHNIFEDSVFIHSLKKSANESFDDCFSLDNDNFLPELSSHIKLLSY